MTLIALISVLSWVAVPPEESRPIPVEAWVKRPVQMVCGEETCMEYQTIYYKRTEVDESSGGYSFNHPLDPGDVLFVRVGGCP